MDPQCRLCRQGWEHCHGTVIVHALQWAECTAPDCYGPDLVGHELRIDCDAVGCVCGQAIALAI
jgi:hypothetical protein